MTRAGGVLGVTQPAISHDLEAANGLHIARHAGRIDPTKNASALHAVGDQYSRDLSDWVNS